MPHAAGRRNRQIVIEQRAPGQDAAGQPLTTWVPVATVMADIRMPTGVAAAERLVADRASSPLTCSMRINWRTGLTAGMRVRHGGVTYDVEQVVPDLVDHGHVDLVCTSGLVA